MKNKIYNGIKNIDKVVSGIAKPSAYILLAGMIMSMILCITVIIMYYNAVKDNTLFDSIHIIRALYEETPAMLICSIIPAMLWDLAEKEIQHKKK